MAAKVFNGWIESDVAIEIIGKMIAEESRRLAHELPIDRLAVYSRDLANETVVCLDTDGLADLTTIYFNDLFAQARRPRRDAGFYRDEYERLRESARQRGETNAAYLTQLTTLADLLA